MAPLFENLPGCILAAGSSRRMGARNKLLIPIGGRPLVCRVIQAYLEAGASELVVVLGHEADLLREALRAYPLTFVEQTRPLDGMSRSIAAGMKALSATASKGFFISPADLPDLSSASIRQLAQVFRANGMERVVRPFHGGIPGHPVFFPRAWADRLCGLSGDAGARTLLDEAEVLAVAVDAPGVVRDLDHVTDFSE